MGECTDLEWAVQVLVNNFDKYSSRCCCCKNPRRISKKDFRKMLSRELNHMLTVRRGVLGSGPGSGSGAGSVSGSGPGSSSSFGSGSASISGFGFWFCLCVSPSGSGSGSGSGPVPPQPSPAPQDTGNRRAADKLICDLDENKDGRISFQEYWTLIGGIASPIAHIIRQQEQSVKLTK